MLIHEENTTMKSSLFHASCAAPRVCVKGKRGREKKGLAYIEIAAVPEEAHRPNLDAHLLEK